MENKIIFDKNKHVVLTFRNGTNSWQDSTNDIKAIYKSFYNGRFSGFDVYFKTGKYFYSKNKLIIFSVLNNVDIFKKDVYVDNVLVYPTAVLLVKNNLHLVKIDKDVLITNSIEIKENKYSNKYHYFNKLGEHALKITNSDDPLNLLAKKYQRFFVNQDSVLKSYFEGKVLHAKDNEAIIMPFDFNQSQLRAIKQALDNNVSVIEGPPGTGKTQTILNLIANLMIRNKKVAVVSNNNAAIENIYNKLIDEGFGYIVAKLGRLDNVNEFFENIDNSEIENIIEEVKDLKYDDKSNIRSLFNEIQQIHKKEIEIAELTKKIEHLRIEKNKFNQKEFKDLSLNNKLNSNSYSNLISTLETPKRIGFFRRIYLKIVYRINLKKDDLLTIIQNLESGFYRTRLLELVRALNEKKRQLRSLQQLDPINSLKTLSETYFKTALYNHYKDQNIKDFSSLNYKSDYKLFIQRFPVVLSTSQSIVNNVPEGFLFDYLIIDEASQSELLSNVLALNTAKKLVVVGDSKQLQQIENEELFEESKKLANIYDIEEAYRYENNSVLKSAKEAVKDVPTTLLKEHYRSAPSIIEFCNQMFYDGELIALTQNEGTHIKIIKTTPGNHARKNPYGSGMYNQREIDEIKILTKNKELGNIGVISPFRYQANMIINDFKNTNLEADTVHKFQGRQKDEIILSFVVNDLKKDSENIENRLYDFINNNALLNVAISRAKTHITAIVSDKLYHSEKNIIKDFIRYSEYLYGDNSSSESKVVSVFDCLYEANKKIRIEKIKNNKKMHLSELLMYRLIAKTLESHPKIGFAMHTRLSNLIKKINNFSKDEEDYIMHPWTHVDFVFYHKVTKETLFVLEVDGIAYHEQNSKQLNRDEIKDRVLLQNNIPCYRFKTNESNEEARLKNILDDFNY